MVKIKQINFKLQGNINSAEESIKDKILKNNSYDETFSNEEINLIDKLIKISIKDKKFISEEELNRIF